MNSLLFLPFSKKGKAGNPGESEIKLLKRNKFCTNI